MNIILKAITGISSQTAITPKRTLNSEKLDRCFAKCRAIAAELNNGQALTPVEGVCVDACVSTESHPFNNIATDIINVDEMLHKALPNLNKALLRVRIRQQINIEQKNSQANQDNNQIQVCIFMYVDFS